MKRSVQAGLFGAGVFLIVTLMFQVGVFSIDPRAILPDVNSEVSRIERIDGAEITRLEPIWLDCRARVHATVPVSGVKEHRVLGQVYRTDAVHIDAVGDVDTCVQGSEVEISRDLEGQHTVVIPADAIVFNRPRVDAVATMDSVTMNKGLVGKLTDSLPWVSDGEGLTAGAYAFAQQIVGGSSCMEAAYEVTEELLIEAYREQLEAEGLDPADVEVSIEGRPDFEQNGPVGLEGFEFHVDAADIECSVADGVGSTPDPIVNDNDEV